MPPTLPLHTVIARARAAVLAASEGVSAPAPASLVATAPVGSAALKSPIPAPRIVLPASTTPQPVERSLEGFRDADDLTRGLILTPTERRTFALLLDLAHHAARSRGYAATPSTAVVHLPAILVAAALGMTDRHLRRVTGRLQEAGLLDYGGHAARVKGHNLWSGTLYAVRMRPDAPAPRLKAQDWRAEWRDLQGDLEAGRTASKAMSQIPKDQCSKVLKQVLKIWAVTPGQTTSPVKNSSDMGAADTVHGLLAVLDAHPTARPGLIGRIASTLARELRDPNSRRFYCALLWRAVEAEHRGVRALSALQHALTRLLVDVREWGNLRRPGALLVARLKVAGCWDALSN